MMFCDVLDGDREAIAVNYSSECSSHQRFFKPLLLSLAGVCLLMLSFLAHAQVNGVGQRPYLGWSSFSEQTINSGFLTQANMTAQSDALASSGLEAHGFRYINID